MGSRAVLKCIVHSACKWPYLGRSYGVNDLPKVDTAFKAAEKLHGLDIAIDASKPRFYSVGRSGFELEWRS